MPYRLILFDIDGTLVDSGDIWGQAVRSGIEKVLRRHKISLPLPTLQEVHKVIGIPGARALDPFIPESHRYLVPEIVAEVRGAGPQSLRRGEGLLMEGAVEVLKELRRRGCFLALASNCRRDYLEEVQNTLGLGQCIDKGYCLDTPGVRSKADMIALALEEFGTRRALMVGDRFLDQEAAHAHGVPFVGFSGGFGTASEWPDAEGWFHHYSEFLPLLSHRQVFIEQMAREIAESNHKIVAVTGPRASGKSLFASEISDVWKSQGVRGPKLIEGGASGMDWVVYLDVRSEVAQRRIGIGGERVSIDTSENAEAAKRANAVIDNSNVLKPVRKK